MRAYHKHRAYCVRVGLLGRTETRIPLRYLGVYSRPPDVPHVVDRYTRTAHETLVDDANANILTSSWHHLRER